MKTIIILAGTVMPQSSPTGEYSKLFGGILKDNYNVKIIFAQTGFKRYFGETIEGIEYYSVSNTLYSLIDFFDEKYKISNSYFLKKIFSSLYIIFRSIRRFLSYFYLPRHFGWFKKKSLNLLDTINEESKVDFILSISNPFITHLTALEFVNKRKKIKWISCTIDPYTTGESFIKKRNFDNYRNRINKDYERNVYRVANSNIVTEEVYLSEKNIIGDAISKTFSIPYVIPILDIEPIDFFQNDSVNLVFAGRFYEDIRNPGYLLELFSNIKNKRIVLHLFASGDCMNSVEKYANNSNGRIIIHNFIDEIKMDQIMISCDVLVNISNATRSFKPSKIFKYISTGKPILDIFKKGYQDEILYRYSNGLQILEDHKKMGNNIIKVEEFCLKNKNIRLSKEDISVMFPNNNIKYIKEILYKSIDI